MLFDPNRVVTRCLMGGGGGFEFSYLRVFPVEFLLKSVISRIDVTRNQSGRT